YDRALLGGKTPAEAPELMRERNAINFTDSVRAPVLFLIGRNDSRCPYGQAMAYVDKLAEREHPHEVVVYETGHASFDVAEKFEPARTARDFPGRHVPGRRKADGIAATPGSTLPSRSSSDAPPPVETHDTRSARPSSCTARTESPPPTTANASASATACATAFV